MPLNSSGQLSLGGSVTGESIAVELGLSPTAQISLNDVDVRKLAGILEGPIRLPIDFWGKSAGNGSTTTKGVFSYGRNNSLTNLLINSYVSNTGVIGSDTSGVGTGRNRLAACGYGTDKGIFGYGTPNGTTISYSMTNLVSNTGVVAGDTAGVGTARYGLAACGYGGDKGVFGYGATTNLPSANTNITNHVSTTGEVATDTTGVGQIRLFLAACSFGGDKGIFGFGGRTTTGGTSNSYSMVNFVSNTGVVSNDIVTVGTARKLLAACNFGGNRGIFGFGNTGIIRDTRSISNIVTDLGFIASDVIVVGLYRYELAACGYGGDKGIFGYGYYSNTGGSYDVSTTNLVSNTGVIATDTAGVGEGRFGVAA
jgi:hypothetical protein